MGFQTRQAYAVPNKGGHEREHTVAPTTLTPADPKRMLVWELRTSASIIEAERARRLADGMNPERAARVARALFAEHTADAMRRYRRRLAYRDASRRFAAQAAAFVERQAADERAAREDDRVAAHAQFVPVERPPALPEPATVLERAGIRVPVIRGAGDDHGGPARRERLRRKALVVAAGARLSGGPVNEALAERIAGLDAKDRAGVAALLPPWARRALTDATGAVA